jgi:ribosomal protein S18 acetylase RimI-like enzyme
VEEIGLLHNLEYMEGPMGFSNMDKAGMLTDGFKEIATMIGLYNHPYYVNHLEKLNFSPEATWIEYKIQLANIQIEKIVGLASAIEKRYDVKSLKFKKSSEIIPYVDEMFGLLNKTYADLQSFVPVQPFQIEHYKTKYIKYIRPDFISVLADASNKLIAFAITMPSMSKAFQKADGSLFPFGFWHLYQATQKNNHAEFYLIGVDPEYQNKGIASLIFRDFYQSFQKNNIEICETNPQLEENKKILQLWKNFEPDLHKKRSTFKLDLGKLSLK